FLSWGFLRFSSLLRRVRNYHRRARHEDARRAVHDDAIARLEARLDDPVLPDPVAHLHRPRFGLAVGADDVHELALRPFLQGTLRHGNRVQPRRTFQGYAYELPRAQGTFRIRDLGARFRGSGGARNAHVGKVELASLGDDGAIGEFHGHVELPAFGQLEAPCRHLAVQLELVVVRHAETD